MKDAYMYIYKMRIALYTDDLTLMLGINEIEGLSGM